MRIPAKATPVELASGVRRKPSPPALSGPVFPRAVVLLVLLVCLDLWMSRHFGIGLSRRPAWLGVLTASWVAVASLLDRTLDDEEKKSMTSRFRDTLRRLLTTPFLIGLLLVLAVLSLGYSSVKVLGLGDKEARAVKLDPVAEGQDAGWIVPGDPGRFLVLSGASSGRAYRLNVPGYRPAVLTVPLFTGLEILPERDLHRPLSFLLRPLPVTLGSLQNGGRLEVWVLEPGKPRQIARNTCRCRASFLLGRKQSIPSDALSRWGLELRALNAAAEGSSPMSQTLLAWTRPQPLVSSEDLLPGTRLDVRVFSPAEKLIVRTSFIVTEESFQDILLLVE
jgi:hypothetical protein